MAVNIAIKVRKGETIERAIRRFKKAIQKAGLIGEMRRCERFVSRSKQKRDKRRRAKRREKIKHIKNQ